MTILPDQIDIDALLGLLERRMISTCFHSRRSDTSYSFWITQFCSEALLEQRH